MKSSNVGYVYLGGFHLGRFREQRSKVACKGSGFLKILSTHIFTYWKLLKSVFFFLEGFLTVNCVTCR